MVVSLGVFNRRAGVFNVQAITDPFPCSGKFLSLLLLIDVRHYLYQDGVSRALVFAWVLIVLQLDLVARVLCQLQRHLRYDKVIRRN